MPLKNIFRFLLCKKINIHEIEIDHQGKKYTRNHWKIQLGPRGAQVLHA